jgi:signal transduction histidine kinase
MPPFLMCRPAGKARGGVWRDLGRGDKKLIGQLVAIAVASMIALLAAGRYAERVVLESESKLRSARLVDFLRDNVSDLPGLLTLGRPTADDLVALRHALQLGEAFRYKLYDAQGRVVVASGQEDVGMRNTETYFNDIVLEGQGFFRIDRRPSSGIFSDALGVPYGDESRVVGKRYVPITQDSRLLGVIEVYLDMTALDQRLRRNSQWFLAGLLAMLGAVGAACASSLRRNIRDRRRAMEQLDEARHRAETLAREAARMLDSLLTCEEEKMSRVVEVVDGISHEIGNPMATLSMGLDALEAAYSQVRNEGCDARLADMRDALDRVAGFLHGLAALSFEDWETGQDVDVNEIVQSLAGLVQLNDRTRDVVFALKLPSDIPSLSLPRRSVSLSLFIILSAAAESIRKAGGRIEVEASMSADGDAVEVRVAASDAAPTLFLSRAAGTSPIGSDHPALDTARRIIESLGGHMVLSAGAPGEHRCELTLPLTSRPESS